MKKAHLKLLVLDVVGKGRAGEPASSEVPREALKLPRYISVAPLPPPNHLIGMQLFLQCRGTETCEAKLRFYGLIFQGENRDVCQMTVTFESSGSIYN